MNSLWLKNLTLAALDDMEDMKGMKILKIIVININLSPFYIFFKLLKFKKIILD